MTSYTFRAAATFFLIVASITLGLWSFLVAPTVSSPARLEEAENGRYRVQATDKLAASAQPGQRRGMRVYIDPDTGKLTSPPAGSRNTVPPGGERTGADEFFEVPAPHGGFEGYFGRRAWKSMSATSKEDGGVDARCGTKDPATIAAEVTR